MTSYQNVSESQIQGYNDCPVLDYSKRSTSSTSIKSRRRLVSQNASTSSLTTTPSTTSLNGPTPIPRPPCFTSPTRKLASMEPTFTAEPSAESVSNDELLESLKQILSLGTSLPEREFQHYEKRLIEQFTKGLDNDSHKAVVKQNLDNYENKDQVKQSLIQFMLSNGGVSTWCLPLRKVLENIKN